MRYFIGAPPYNRALPIWNTRKETSQAEHSCQAMERRVHLTLFISRNMVAMAATQGMYSRMNTRKA